MINTNEKQTKVHLNSKEKLSLTCGAHFSNVNCFKIYKPLKGSKTCEIKLWSWIFIQSSKGFVSKGTSPDFLIVANDAQHFGLYRWKYLKIVTLNHAIIITYVVK